MLGCGLRPAATRPSCWDIMARSPWCACIFFVHFSLFHSRRSRAHRVAHSYSTVGYEPWINIHENIEKLRPVAAVVRDLRALEFYTNRGHRAATSWAQQYNKQLLPDTLVHKLKSKNQNQGNVKDRKFYLIYRQGSRMQHPALG